MPALHEILPVTPEAIDRYQILSPEASLEVIEAIAVSGTFKNLRRRSSLNVMQRADGEQFVTRDYSQHGVDSIGRKTGVEFGEAWDIMHEMYGRAAINIVPSFVIDHGSASKYKRLTVVSAYLPEATPLGQAATPPKIELAFKLGRLMHDSRRYAPAQEALMPDMFHATTTTDQADILLTDVDPYVINNLMISRGGPAEQFKDKAQSDYILRIADLIWDNWCEGNADERESVTRSFVNGLGTDVFIGITSTSEVSMELVARSNGYRGNSDTRQLNLQA
jgi:hypothetical protein